MQRKLFTVSVAYLITLAETSFSISIILCRGGRHGGDGMSRVREQFVIRREQFNVSVALTSVFLLVACLPKVSLDTARRLGCTRTHGGDAHVQLVGPCHVGATLIARGHMLTGHFQKGKLIPSLSWLTWHRKKEVEFILKMGLFGGFDKRGERKVSAQGSRGSEEDALLLAVQVCQLEEDTGGGGDLTMNGLQDLDWGHGGLLIFLQWLVKVLQFENPLSPASIFPH